MIKIALAGNPNSGKTTLFNALTGSNQFVGNWPGVTVEKKEGKLIRNGKACPDIIITDLPGVYSLSPYTLEEVVARDYLINERPDAILNIIDGTNIERNLFLTTQITELGIPVVAAVNMMDVVEKRGEKIDVDALSKALGCRVAIISALKNTGIEEAAEAAIEASGKPPRMSTHSFSGPVEHALAHIEEFALHEMPPEQQRFYSIKLFERDKDIIGKLGLTPEQVAHIEGDIRRREEEIGDDSESVIITERYNYIDSIINNCVKNRRKTGPSASDKIDRIVTNRFLALPVFAAVMFIVYFVSVSSVGAYLTNTVNQSLFKGVINPAIAGVLSSANCAVWLQNLILDGILAGVGAVLGFVPQLMLLFTFLAFLEACGYMSRIAFILDRVFRKFGLSGKSFIPILIGTGCGVPGIMAARTIENPADRKMTVITTTFIPCGAKLPVIALFAGAVFAGAGWVAAASYFIGLAAIVISGLILKNTRLFSGADTPFVMELPPYHLPSVKSVLRSMWERAWDFIRKAGTVILLGTVVIWFLSNYGFRSEFAGSGFGAVGMGDSILAKIGGAAAFLFKPLGWGDWKASVAVFTGLFAKENIVGTFGILFGESGDGFNFRENLANPAVGGFTAVTGFSFLVFNLLCAPCIAAMSAIKREIGGWKWFLFAFLYQTLFAYLVSFCIYNSTVGIGLILAVIIALIIRSLIRRKGRADCAQCGNCAGSDCFKSGRNPQKPPKP